MSKKPVARPRPEPVPAPPPPAFPTVAVKIINHDGVFYFYATDGVRSWSGSSAAPTRDALLVDVFSDVRADVGGPIRFAISVPPTNPIWRHINELQTALGCLVERAHLGDRLLVEEAADRLNEMLPVPHVLGSQAPLAVEQPAEEHMEPAVGEPLTVATDGSVRGCFTGYGWLAHDGRFRLHGSRKPKGLRIQKAVLLTELRAIDDAVRSLPGHPLTVLTDSTVAASLVSDWMAGCDIFPPGFLSGTTDQHPMAHMRDSIHSNRDRLSCRWVRAHQGDLLNEGADALARLASRYVRGDNDLTEHEFNRRAAGLAEGFTEEFLRCRQDEGSAV
jgi:ribonuclease HI